MVNVLFVFSLFGLIAIRPSTFADRCQQGETSIRLLVLLPKADGDTPLRQGYGVALRLGLELAAEQINNRSDLLACHELKLVYKETGCTAGDYTQTAVGLTSGLFPNNNMEKVAGVVGPVCFLDSSLVSLITGRPELQLVLLHSAGSALLPDSATNALDILGSTRPLVDLYIGLMKKNDWHNVAILFENTLLFYKSIAELFISRIESDEYEINIKYVSNIGSDFYPLDQVWNRKARIVLVFASTPHSLRIMCLAHHMKLVYPDYQWIIIDQKLDDFKVEPDVVFTYEGKEYRCSSELMVTSSLERAFLINFQLSAMSPDEDTFANLTFKEFLKLYTQRVDEYNSEYLNATISPTYRSYTLYDTVWAWGIVLN